MNKKISRILGVVLSLTLLASMMLWAIPVPIAAAPGDTQWARESLPGTTNMKSGASITGIAVADASTIYAIDNAGAANATMIYKSTNSGQSFSAQAGYPAAALAPVAIAVAADDVNSVAVSDGTNIHYSNDGGTSWATLPAFASNLDAAGNNNGVCVALAVGPKRSGLALGREYFAAIADPDAANILDGDIEIIGGKSPTYQPLQWNTIAAQLSVGDFTNVILSPNYANDTCILTVRNTAVAGSTSLCILNIGSNAFAAGTAPIAVHAAAAGGVALDYDGAFAAANTLASSSIAVPTNFDPATDTGRRIFVGLATNAAAVTADDDVFRVDDTTSRALACGQRASSVAYTGTVETGTLFIGARGSGLVRRTSNAHTTSPTWASNGTNKGPNAAVGVLVRTLVVLASDFTTSNTVFAATSRQAAAGEQNGFFISTDGGVTFNGECFLNAVVGNTIVAIQGMKITPDGSTIFLAANDGTRLQIWKSSSAKAISGSSWARILNVNALTAGNGCLMGMSPAWDTTPALYLADCQAGGNGTIYVSQDGGVTFFSRNGPTLPGVTILAAIALQDANTIYAGSGANVYKSTNGGWGWGDAVDAKAGNINSIVVPMADHVLVGGTNDTGYSKNGGTSFTGESDGLAGAGAIQICADQNYATNNTIYAAAAAAAPWVSRYIIGTSTQWENLIPATAAAKVGIAMKNDTLYALGVNRADRTLRAREVVGTLEWGVMVQGVPAPVFAFLEVAGDSSGNTLFAADTSAGALLLCTYNDWLAVTPAGLITPVNNAPISINPNLGTSANEDLMWKPMGSGTGLVNVVDVDIRTKATGFIDGAVSNPAQASVGSTPSFACAGLRANTEYIWRVRACGTLNGEAIVGPWSEVRTMKIQSGAIINQPYAGPVLTGPTGGAMNVNPGLVGFSWAPVSGATEYTVIVATDAGLTQTVGGTPVKVSAPAYSVSGLDYETTYFWSVKATKPTEGVQAIGTFTTMAKAAPVATTAPPPAATSAPPQIVMPTPETPAYIWAVIVIGAILVIAVIILIVRTRRVP
ncbi:MAG: hypothetical protein ABIB93_01170 [Chloroflexota bacterium]